MTLKQVKPLGQKLLVKLLPLYIGENALKLALVDQKKGWDHKVRRAEVLATGPRVREIRAGDQVMFAGHAGKWVNPPGSGCEQDASDYRAVEEKEVLCILG